MSQAPGPSSAISMLGRCTLAKVLAGCAQLSMARSIQAQPLVTRCADTTARRLAVLPLLAKTPQGLSFRPGSVMFPTWSLAHRIGWVELFMRWIPLLALGF